MAGRKPCRSVRITSKTRGGGKNRKIQITENQEKLAGTERLLVGKRVKTARRVSQSKVLTFFDRELRRNANFFGRPIQWDQSWDWHLPERKQKRSRKLGSLPGDVGNAAQKIGRW